MTIRLRGHHLLCMLTYIGKGYTPGFTINYDSVAERLNSGEEIEIVSGPDDICAPLLTEKSPHCHGESVNERDAAALASVGQLLGCDLVPGSRINPDLAYLAKLRHAFGTGTLRIACSGCEWSSLCDKVAGSGFRGAKIVGGNRAELTPRLLSLSLGITR